MDIEREIGAALRAAREAKEMDIQAAVQATKIRSKYLTALENGDFGSIPGEVYVKGYIRSYARFLGVDGEKMVQQYKEALAAAAAPETAAGAPVAARKPAAASTAPIPAKATAKPPAARLPEKRYRLTARGRRQWSVIAAAVLLLMAAPWLIRALRPPAPVTPPVPNQNEPASGAENPGLPANGETSGGEPADSPAAAVEIMENTSRKITYAVTGDGIDITIAAEARCWLEIKADGESPYSFTLAPGESKSAQAVDKLTVRAGNAGGITLTANGAPLGIPGTKDTVKNIEFIRQ